MSCSFLQVANAESVLTIHGSGASSRALRMVNVLNLYITNGAGQVRKRELSRGVSSCSRKEE
jgi:hypothetical protein